MLQLQSPLHCTTLPSTPLHYTTLHRRCNYNCNYYITLITLLYNTLQLQLQLQPHLHYTALQLQLHMQLQLQSQLQLRFFTPHHTTRHSTTVIALHDAAPHFAWLHHTTLKYTTLYCSYNYIALRYTNCIQLRYLHPTTLITAHYSTPHYTTLHYSKATVAPQWHHTTPPFTTLHPTPRERSTLTSNYIYSFNSGYTYTTTLHEILYATLQYTTPHYITIFTFQSIALLPTTLH